MHDNIRGTGPDKEVVQPYQSQQLAPVGIGSRLGWVSVVVLSVGVLAWIPWLYLVLSRRCRRIDRFFLGATLVTSTAVVYLTAATEGAAHRMIAWAVLVHLITVVMVLWSRLSRDQPSVQAYASPFLLVRDDDCR